MRIRYNELIKRYGQKGIKVTPRRPFQKVRYDKETLMEDGMEKRD